MTEEPHDMAAGGTAEDAVLVLEADDVGVAEVEEVGGAEIRIELLLLDLEPDLRRVVVPFREVVDRDHEAVGAGELGGRGGAEVVRESGDPALAREIVADERDLPDFTSLVHGGPRITLNGHRGRRRRLPPRSPTERARARRDRPDRGRRPEEGHRAARHRRGRRQRHGLALLCRRGPRPGFGDRR